MKKALLTLMFAALSFMTFGQRWTALSSETPARPQVELISSSEEQIVVSFSLCGFYTNRVETPNGIQNVISVPKMAANLVAGTPDLPQFPIPAIIGDRAEMQVSVIDAQYTDFNIEVAPSKGNISRQVNPNDVPYTYGAMYSQDAFYPAAQAYLEAPYISRDFRGQNIMVTPFAYNPVTKTLRVFTNMTIAMNKVSDNGENQKAARKSNNIKVDPEMKQAYSRRFINFGQTRYEFTEDRGTMLVICPEQYMEAMQPLVEWKNQSGRPCTMVSVADAGGNNENNIKAYIQNLYENDNLEFVLFVGDYNDITPHSMNGGRSDNWFVMLEGNDYYLEAFVGRFSVESVHDVETHVNKVLYYERDMPEEVTWANQGLGIGAIGAGTGLRRRRLPTHRPHPRHPAPLHLCQRHRPPPRSWCQLKFHQCCRQCRCQHHQLLQPRFGNQLGRCQLQQQQRQCLDQRLHVAHGHFCCLPERQVQPQPTLLR